MSEWNRNVCDAYAMQTEYVAIIMILMKLINKWNETKASMNFKWIYESKTN